MLPSIKTKTYASQECVADITDSKQHSKCSYPSVCACTCHISKPKVLVISSIPPRKPTDKPGESWEDLAQLTCATHKKYCDQWGYDYHLDVSDLYEQVNPTTRGSLRGPSVPIYYKIKFLLFQHFLDPDSCGKEYDYVAWLDSDLVLTDYNTPLETFLNGRLGTTEPDPQEGDITLTYDINGLHATVIILRRTALTLGYAYANAESAMRYFLTDYWSDQLSQRFELGTPPYQGLVRYYSVKKLCAMHPGIYTQLPRIAREPYEWDEKESWALHLSALSIPKRIEIAKQYVEKYGLL